MEKEAEGSEMFRSLKKARAASRRCTNEVDVLLGMSRAALVVRVMLLELLVAQWLGKPNARVRKWETVLKRQRQRCTRG